MGFKKSVLACMGGVLLAGCIMGILSVLGVSAFGAVVQ
jgi:putative small multidrug export related protein